MTRRFPSWSIRIGLSLLLLATAASRAHAQAWQVNFINVVIGGYPACRDGAQVFVTGPVNPLTGTATATGTACGGLTATFEYYPVQPGYSTERVKLSLSGTGTTSTGCRYTVSTLITGNAAPGGTATLSGLAMFNSCSGFPSGTQTVTGSFSAQQTTTTTCTYTMSTSLQRFPAAGGSGTVGVTAPSGCAWTAASQVSWVTISSGASGSGNGTIAYVVGGNTTVVGRTGSITVSNGPTLTITQDAGSGTLPPGAPGGLGASVSGSTVTLTWSAPTTGSPPTAYRVEIGSAPGGLDVVNASTGSTTSAYSTTLASGTYYARVRATNDYGTSTASNEVTVVVTSPSTPAVPGAPSGLSGSVSGRTVTLTWSAPTTGGTPTSYRVEIGSAVGGADVVSIATGSTATTYATTLNGPGTFYARVRAVNSTGTGPASNEITFIIRDASLDAPGVPVALTSSVDGSTVMLTWGPPATGGTPTVYILEAGSSSGAANLAALSLDANQRSYTAFAVARGTYYVRMKAGNAAGVSGASNEVSFTVSGVAPCSGAPRAPTGLTFSLFGSTVALAWTAVDQATTSYMIEAGSRSGLADLADFDTGSAQTTFTTTGVGPGVYYVRVRGTHACGTSGSSNEVILTVY